jgi:hypothetical protein
MWQQVSGCSRLFEAHEQSQGALRHPSKLHSVTIVEMQESTVVKQFLEQKID